MFPNQLVMHAKRRMMDSEYIRAQGRIADADGTLDSARASLTMAQELGWDGDIDAFMAEYLASPSCDFSR